MFGWPNITTLIIWNMTLEKILSSVLYRNKCCFGEVSECSRKLQFANVWEVS